MNKYQKRYSLSHFHNLHIRHKMGLTLTATKRGVFQIEQFECVLKDPFHLLTVHLPVLIN